MTRVDTPPEPAPTRHRIGSVTLLLTALLVLVASLPFAASLALYSMYRSQIVREEEMNARRTAELLLKSFEQAIDSADALLLNFALSFNPGWTPEQIHASLAGFSLPRSITRLEVVDRSGIVLASNMAAPEGEKIDLSDQEHIRVHAGQTTAGGNLFIGKPLRDRLTRRWIIQFSRALTDAQGQVVGAVVAAYAMEDFIAFYKSLRIDDDMLIGIVGFDGIVRGAATRQPHFGTDISESPPFKRALQNKESVYEFKSTVDGVERLGYMIQSDRYPIVVTVASSLRFIYEHMSSFRAAILGTGAALGGALLLLGLLASRYLSIHRRLNVQEMEAEARRRETQMLNAISQVPGVCVIYLTPDGASEIGTPSQQHLSTLVKTYLGSARFRAASTSIDEPVVRSEQLSDDTGAFEVEMVIAPLRTMNAMPSGPLERDLVIFAVDQTPRRMEERKLHQMFKLASLGEVATGLAHEINQPLGVIRLAASNALTGMKLGLPQEHLTKKLDRIIQQTERMSRIIDHMRIFGRKSDDRLQPCHPLAAVAGALQMVSAHFRLDNIQVTTHRTERLPQVLCRQEQLEQVLINLLQNARDAVHERRKKSGIDLTGRIGIDVTLETDIKGGPMVRIEVADNGGGVPDDVMDHVFQPFFTTKPPGKGTGLGLSVSFGIIRDQGGGLSVRNGPEGAVFTILLPAKRQDAAAISPAPSFPCAPRPQAVAQPPMPGGGRAAPN